ncbi:SPOR domain-containing protein [Campylobacter geochelonis]|uniref:Membrane protein n=1 Tax=Campylobacter geochelonis TaxID=1780362 RepID=A0A128EFJ0_9BACT|nr:SPOR domain-containing protein [Campylobacter geochelonis]QKF71886.1 hypothetical protein CGEO_1609 [Campylobacter geochelonis]CZE47337.1 membrane protein [Campylobacter geochelonis]
MKDNKFNLNDSIVLDPEKSRSNNVKKILTAIAILVVLFLIVLIIMKFINSGGEVDNKPLVMPSEELIFKPKPEAQEPQKTIIIEEKPKVNEASQPQTPSATSQVIKPTVVEPIKQEIKVEVKPVETKPVEAKPIEPKPIEIKKVEPIKTKSEVKKVEPKKEVVVVTAKKEQPKTATKPEKKAPVKKVEPKTKVNPTATKAQKPTTSHTDVPKGSYIQVLATSEFKPDADYIKKLESKGYGYKLHKTTVNGKEFTKVLVGPYSGAELSKEIANIRAAINKNAFIYKVK